MKTDQNTRFLVSELHIRGQIVQLEHSYQSVLANADYPPAVAELLGQALAAVSALGSIIKLRGSIIMQMQGDGPLHTLVVQANNAGEIRGLAHGYEALDEEANFSELLGVGRLVMTVDAQGGKRYQGIVQLEGEQLSDVLGIYFEQSEQLKTSILLAANNRRATCFLLQQLPGTGGQKPHESWQHAKILSDTLTEPELLELDAEQILHRLFHQQEVQVYEPVPLTFRCRCSREKVIPAIVQMGYKEAMLLIEEQGEITVNCEFCNQTHRFDRIDVASLFKAHAKAPARQQ